jgi:DNA-binding response OmpR family regulator
MLTNFCNACPMARIIIADDDELIIEVVRAALDPRGHIVGALPDGNDVQRIVEQRRPDLLILDCAMPGLSGVQVLRNLRNSHTAYAVPVLMLTARASTADENIALLAGADEYLRKPFDPDQLVAAVESLLEQSAKRAAQKARQGRKFTSV